jgi:hypothetical protein
VFPTFSGEKRGGVTTAMGQLKFPPDTARGRSAVLTSSSRGFVWLPWLLPVHCPGTARLLHRWVRYPNKSDLASWHLGFLRFSAENELLRGEVPNSSWHPGLLAPANVAARRSIDPRERRATPSAGDADRNPMQPRRREGREGREDRREEVEPQRPPRAQRKTQRRNMKWDERRGPNSKLSPRTAETAENTPAR